MLCEKCGYDIDQVLLEGGHECPNCREILDSGVIASARKALTDRKNIADLEKWTQKGYAFSVAALACSWGIGMYAAYPIAVHFVRKAREIEVFADKEMHSEESEFGPKFLELTKKLGKARTILKVAVGIHLVIVAIIVFLLALPSLIDFFL